MSLSILTDEQIKYLLESLTVDELEAFNMDLKGALHDYSVGSQSGEDSDIHQPHRQTINSSRTGATTLFMPSGSPAGVGVKGAPVHPHLTLRLAPTPALTATLVMTCVLTTEQSSPSRHRAQNRKTPLANPRSNPLAPSLSSPQSASPSASSTPAPSPPSVPHSPQLAWWSAATVCRPSPPSARGSRPTGTSAWP